MNSLLESKHKSYAWLKQSFLMIFLCLFLFGCFAVNAQELNCTVTVTHQNITNSTNTLVYKQLESTIRDYLNNTKWTKDVFQTTERIECNIVLDISAYDGSAGFAGHLQVKSTRTAYGTSYNSNLLNILDNNIQFSYTPGLPPEYIEGSYSDLSSIFAYYAFIIIAVDYDSYAEFGGTDYFTKAQNIVNSAQTSSISGWKSQESDDKNRYFIVNGYLDDRYKPFRSAWYMYHRQGLDTMAQDPVKGRDYILSALEMLQKLNSSYTNCILIQLFNESKSRELISLFAKASSSQKEKARDILIQIDVANSGTYQDKIRP